MLVGYDGSASADQAVALVAGLAWPAPSECRIVVACGVQIETYAPGMVPDAETLQTIYDAKQNDAERLATAASQRIARPGLAATWEGGFNRPANTILDVADRFDPDLLVVGSRDLGPFTSALLRVRVRGARRPRRLPSPRRARHRTATGRACRGRLARRPGGDYAPAALADIPSVRDPGSQCLRGSGPARTAPGTRRDC